MGEPCRELHEYPTKPIVYGASSNAHEADASAGEPSREAPSEQSGGHAERPIAEIIKDSGTGNDKSIKRTTNCYGACKIVSLACNPGERSF